MKGLLTTLSRVGYGLRKQRLAMNDLIPITDETWKAIQEVAKTTGLGVDLVRAAGGYLAKVFGSAPEDLFGMLIGDPLRARRIRNMILQAKAAQELLKAQSIESHPPPLSLVAPILEGAMDEERPELAELWAKLLAAAMDPARTGQVRRMFIDAVKAMDPVDALVLDTLPKPVMEFQPNVRTFLSGRLGRGEDDIGLSLIHLIELRILHEPGTRPNVPIALPNQIDFTALGRELTRVLRA